MSLDGLPNEPTVRLRTFCSNSSLNALVQSSKRCAALLTPVLYHDEICFQATHSPMRERGLISNPRLRFLNCIPFWSSDTIIGYLRGLPNATFTLVGKYGETLLHHAAIGGNAKLVELFLSKNEDIDAGGMLNRSPLHYAVYSKDETTFNAILDHGANVISANEDSETVLFAAILYCSIKMVERIINSIILVPGNIFAPFTGASTLNLAVCGGNKSGVTALTGAAYWGHDNMVNLLPDYGAGIMNCDSVRLPALAYADGLQNNSLFQSSVISKLYVHDDISRLPASSHAKGVQDNNTFQRVVRATLEAGGDISAPCGRVESGANVLAPAHNDATALAYSLLNYDNNRVVHEQVGQVLITAMRIVKADFSAPFESRLGSQMIYLHLATDLGAKSLVQILIESAADALALDDKQRTALLLIIFAGHEATGNSGSRLTADIGGLVLGGLVSEH
ncbi:hypothetical protein B7463_g9125, partial [Scytalidium lignicola]